MLKVVWGLLRWFSGKESTCQCRRLKTLRFHPWAGRSPGEGNGNPLQGSCLGNPMDRGALQATNSPWGHERVGHNLATAAAAARVVMDTKRGAPRGPRISITLITALSVGFPDGLAVKNPPANAGDTGSVPGLGRLHMLQGN